MATISSFEDFKKEVKKRDLVNKAKRVANTAYEKRYEIAGFAVGAAMVLGQIRRTVESIRDQHDQDCKFYDHSAGHRWETKRKLSNSEWLEVEEIQNRYGCSKGEALKKMGLLKK